MLEYQKITKKAAFQLLENHENLLICSIWKNENYCKDLLLKQYKNLKNQINDLEKPEYRSIIKKQSNAVQFNNGSWLYYNDFKKAYLLDNNFMILSKEENSIIYYLN